MIFNSITYAIFLPVVFIIYWYLLRDRLKLQNGFLLVASYFFYCCWDWKFLGLLIFTTLTTFFAALLIEKTDNKKFWLIANITANLAVLGTFKYLNFFLENAINLLENIGFHIADHSLLNIILPVGISFYTLQAISYTVDVYKRKICATSDYIAFSTYIAFFPQLVAGPIERSVNLLPQIQKNRVWDYAEAVNGMRQILWGLFKKVAVADLCGVYVDRILSDVDYYNGSTVLLAIILFCFQIYGDFSGYSDMAIGTARLFGIKLSTNFRYPYFAYSIRDFWKRWHISLMTWLRDYVYIPLGGSRKSKARTYFNIVIVFLISGLWHGAAWTYILWGAFWAVAYIAERALTEKGETKFNVPHYLFTLVAILISFLIFRANSIEDIANITTHIFTPAMLSMPTGLTPFITIIPMMIIEYAGRHKDSPLENLSLSAPVRWLLYTALTYSIIFAVDESSAQFIYFQF